jgi:BirA family transcriptional regulator, biotin operon repressor / biotin---[acetyl-CoA-carboxylase] ligase
MDRLDAALIELPGVEVRVVERCGSTNAVLLSERGRGAALLATEEQTAGRGRRGRRWYSLPGADLTFSLAVSLQRPARELAALSLVAGVAATRTLRAAGVSGVALKWPNDLVVDGAKLGGILVETRAEGRLTRAVVGIGINCRRSPALAAALRRRVASVDEFIAPDRNALIRHIALALLAALEGFELRGFDAAEWEALDAHAGQRLRVRLSDGRTLSGIACGLAEDGALRLRNRSGIRAVRSGRVVAARAA